MLAYTYPLLDFFWTMLVLFGFIVWFWLLIAVFIDIFRSHDLGGLAKALWVLFVIVIPLIGVLVYLITRGGKMGQHALETAERQQRALDVAVREAAGSPGSAHELAKLADLKDRGVITETEFQAKKEGLLS